MYTVHSNPRNSKMWNQQNGLSIRRSFKRSVDEERRENRQTWAFLEGHHRRPMPAEEGKQKRSGHNNSVFCTKSCCPMLSTIISCFGTDGDNLNYVDGKTQSLGGSTYAIPMRRHSQEPTIDSCQEKEG